MVGTDFVGCSVGTVDDASRHGRHHRRVANVSHKPRVAGSDFYGSMDRRSRSATDENRRGHATLLSESRHVAHFVERRRDKTAETDDVGTDFRSLVENLLRRDHNSQVDHVETVAAEHHVDDVFADVVHVAFDRRHENLSGAATGVVGLLRLDERLEPRHGVFHHARTLNHLRQKHFAFAEKRAHLVHARH